MDLIIYKILILISFTVIVLCEKVTKDVSVRFVSDSKILKPGSDANITCDYYAGMGSYHRKWIKKDGVGEALNISLNDNLLISDKRYSVETYQSRGRDARNFRMYTLYIRNVSSNDSGSYECLIYLTDGSVVNKTSSLYVFSNEYHQTALEGDDVRISCLPEGYFPIFDVVWTPIYYPQGGFLDNGDFVITSAISNDTGLYPCRASYYTNDTDYYRVRTFMRLITLEVVPPLHVFVRNPLLIRPVGYSVNITCLIHSLAPVEVKWLKNDLTIDYLGKSYKGNRDSSGKSLQIASLQISNITNNDYAVYKCLVGNMFKSFTETVILTNVT